jgi:hypothetical protein
MVDTNVKEIVSHKLNVIKNTVAQVRIKWNEKKTNKNKNKNNKKYHTAGKVPTSDLKS